MASTLTWNTAVAGATSAAATAVQFFTDLNTLVTAQAGNSAFAWQVGTLNTSNTLANPTYITLVQKSTIAASGGIAANPGPVILICNYASAPSFYNTNTMDAVPATSQLQVSYFPSATTVTPAAGALNVTGSTQAITTMGNDTNCVKMTNMVTGIATVYTVGYQLSYADSADCVYISMGPTASSWAAQYAFMAGLGIVDYSGNVYGCCVHFNSSPTVNSTGIIQLWVASGTATESAAASDRVLRTNYGAANRTYYDAFVVPGWAAQTAGVTADILQNNTNGYAYFAPIQLMGNAKGEGVVLKLRQIGFGPQTIVNYTNYYTTGPVVAASQLVACTGGTANASVIPWLTDFQL